MKQRSNDEEAVRHYLLGQLQEAEQIAIEDRFLMDDDYFERLEMIEDELIDDYVTGTLSEPDRQAFSAHFLAAPERKKKLKFALAMTKYAGMRATGTDKSYERLKETVKQTQWRGWIGDLLSTPYFKVAAIPSFVVLLLAALGLLYFTLRGPRVLSPMDNELAKLNQKDLSDLSEYGAITRLTVTSETTRDSSEIRTLSLRDASDLILIRLALPSGLTDERVRVKINWNFITVANLDVRAYTNQSTRDVRILLPRAKLTAGRYTIAINDDHPATGASYIFDVEP